MRRARHLAGVALVALLLLAAATSLNGWLPEDASDAVADPFVRSAGVGETVDLRMITLEVDSVRGASSIDEFGTEETSPGVWVVVTYTVEAKRESSGIFSAEVRDDRGRVWDVSHGRGQNTCSPAPPGVRNGCVVVFEVPPDALPSLHLHLAPLLEQRYDAVADIDLGLTAEDAADFASVTGLEVPGTTLGGS